MMVTNRRTPITDAHLPYLLVELDVVQDFQSLVKVAEQGMKPQKTDQ